MRALLVQDKRLNLRVDILKRHEALFVRETFGGSLIEADCVASTSWQLVLCSQQRDAFVDEDYGRGT